MESQIGVPAAAHLTRSRPLHVRGLSWGQSIVDHSKWAAWGILATSLILTAMAWRLSNQYLHQRAQDRFAFRTGQVRDAIATRMGHYEHVLRTGAVVRSTFRDSSMRQWNEFIASQNLRQHYSGIQAVGLSHWVTRDRREEFVTAMRLGGLAGFDIHPPGDRDHYVVLDSIEPLDAINARAIGFDQYWEPVRREAIDRAIASGDPAATGIVRLIQETRPGVQNGFIMYHPVYKEGHRVDTPAQRRGAIEGFVALGFRTADLMAGILHGDNPDLHFDIYDGLSIAADHCLFESHHRSGDSRSATQMATRDDSISLPAAPFAGRQTLTVGGRQWTMQFAADASFIDTFERTTSLLVAAGALIVDALVFVIIASLSTRNQRAKRLAQQMTQTIHDQVKELRRINGELDDFAYIASHDLRSPLRNIRHLANWAVEDAGSNLPPDAQEHLGSLQDRVAIMDRLLSDLLQYSRVARGDEPIKLVDCQVLIDDVLAAIDPPPTMTIIRRGDLPVVCTARRPLATCLHHLIANAVGHHDRPDGRVEIRVRVRAGSLQIEVQDDGPGIDAQFHGRIFKVFQTLRPAGDSGSSTGIGLAVVKKAAQSYGGTVQVRSVPGRGSTFTLRWPVQVAPPAAAAEPVLSG